MKLLDITNCSLIFLFFFTLWYLGILKGIALFIICIFITSIVCAFIFILKHLYMRDYGKT